jgi:aminoglycoside phosphotransferase family enzyme/predicted kinase
MKTQLQTECIQAMSKADFYPHGASTIEQRETHISRVFLTGQYAYKIKKPVYLEFLDFTTLKKRKHFCRQEVSLNKRLTKDVYLDVVPITLQKGRYYLAGPGETVEYAVKMRQLPEKFSMRQLLRGGKITRDSIDELARVLANFYRHLPIDDNIKKFGNWSTIWTNAEENFSQTEQFAGNLLDEHMFQIIQASTRSFLIRHKALFDRRVERKKIRDCHGDLRTGHIYFYNGIQIIDCIEFNDRFRYADITSDLAFLAMDLDFEGYPQVARHLINSFIDYTKDEEMFVLLDFYKCYRAYVRAKVGCLGLQQEDMATSRRNKLLRETRRYLNLAYRYAVQFTRPTIWVVCGLPASGKTTMAKMIAKLVGLGIIGSDIVRKKLFGVPLYESQDLPFEGGIYSKASTALVYGQLLMMAQEEIEKGCSIILDATFSTHHQRDEALRLARDADANIIFVECTASKETLKKRLSLRDEFASVSDARLPHFKHLRARFEPINELPDEMHICIDTEKPLQEGMQQILAHDYALLSKQTDRAIRHWGFNSPDVGFSLGR